MIVDCHTHWGSMWGDRDGHDPSKWLQLMDSYNITHAIVLGHRGLVDACETERDHDDVAAVCANSDGRMIQFLSVHTAQGKKALREAERCLDLGARGMKFHPWLQGESLADPTMDELAELAADRGVPLYFHDGTPAYSLPSQMAGLARRHPRTTIVLGHGGLLEYWREGIDAVRRCPNLWACMCGVPAIAMREYVSKCDNSRLLWGSDFGFSFSDRVGYFLGMLYDLNLSDKVLETILADNPGRLLGIQQ